VKLKRIIKFFIGGVQLVMKVFGGWVKNKFGICIICTLHLHQNYIMGRISATFKPSIEGMIKAYADFHKPMSFSEATEIMAGKSVLEWFNALSEAQKKAYNKKFKIFNKINQTN